MEKDAGQKRGIVRRVLPVALVGCAAMAIGAAVTGGRVDQPTHAGQTHSDEKTTTIPATPPNEEPAPLAEAVTPAVDPLELVSLDVRRQVFLAYDRAETNTHALAASLFPGKDAPADAEGQALYRNARAEREAELRQAARRTLVRRFGIEEEALDAILKQARAETWSLQEIADEEVDPASPVAKASPERARGGRRGGGGGGAGRTRGGSRR